MNKPLYSIMIGPRLYEDMKLTLTDIDSVKELGRGMPFKQAIELAEKLEDLFEDITIVQSKRMLDHD